MDIITIDIVLDFPHLAINNNIQLILASLIIRKLIFIFPNMNNPTLSILEFSRNLQILFTFNKSFTYGDIVGMRLTGDISEV